MTKHLMNWVSHVKKWASDNDCKYEQALKSVECRNAYKNKGSNSEQKQEVVNEVKPRRKYVRKNKIEAPSELPKEVLQVISKRKYARKNPAIPSPI